MSIFGGRSRRQSKRCRRRPRMHPPDTSRAAVQSRQHEPSDPIRRAEEVSAVVQDQGEVPLRTGRHHPLQVRPLALLKVIQMRRPLARPQRSPGSPGPGQAATSVFQPRDASSRSSVHTACSVPPTLAPTTGNKGYATSNNRLLNSYSPETAATTFPRFFHRSSYCPLPPHICRSQQRWE